jgi:hypothetical protein
VGRCDDRYSPLLGTLIISLEKSAGKFMVRRELSNSWSF